MGLIFFLIISLMVAWGLADWQLNAPIEPPEKQAPWVRPTPAPKPTEPASTDAADAAKTANETTASPAPLADSSNSATSPESSAGGTATASDTSTSTTGR